MAPILVSVTDDDLLGVLDEAARSVAAAIGVLDDWGLAGTRHGQYRSDLAADDVALPMLHAAGLGVVSEESHPRDTHRDVVAVIDPVDGSTNAASGLPWWATSICALDSEGPLAAVVVNQATQVVYTAIRGAGAFRDGVAITASACDRLADAICVFNGLPPRYLGWRQFRVMGAAALDLCAVADGTFDAFARLQLRGCPRRLGLPGWAGSCAREAGAVVVGLRTRVRPRRRRPMPTRSHRPWLAASCSRSRRRSARRSFTHRRGAAR